MAELPATARLLTAARIALGHTGASLPTAAHLDFQLAHARARDAVHQALAVEPLLAQLQSRGYPVLRAHSAAVDRRQYLQRPDLGRRLDEASRSALAAWAGARSPAPGPVLVLADGLSARAIEHHALAVLDALEALQTAPRDDPPVVIVVEQGRVAIGDEIGELLHAPLVAVLIGERPGLSAPDSLGIYLTWGPRVGTLDAARNCLSNIRDGGMDATLGAAKLDWLMREARRRQVTGVALKEALGGPALTSPDGGLLPP